MQFLMSTVVLILALVVVNRMGNCESCQFYTNYFDEYWCHIMVFTEGVDFEARFFATTDTRPVVSGDTQIFTFSTGEIDTSLGGFGHVSGTWQGTGSAGVSLSVPTAVRAGGHFLRSESCLLYQEPLSDQSTKLVFRNASSPLAEMVVFPHCRVNREERHSNGAVLISKLSDEDMAQFEKRDFPMRNMILSIVVWWVLFNAGTAVGIVLELVMEDETKQIAAPAVSALSWCYAGLLLLPFSSMTVHHACPQIVMINHFNIFQDMLIAALLVLSLVGCLVGAALKCQDDDIMKCILLATAPCTCPLVSGTATVLFVQAFASGFTCVIPGIDFRFLFSLPWPEFDLSLKISAIRIMLFVMLLMGFIKTLTVVITKLLK